MVKMHIYVSLQLHFYFENKEIKKDYIHSCTMHFSNDSSFYTEAKPTSSNNKCSKSLIPRSNKQMHLRNNRETNV